jgi:hypothetical protein
MALRIRMKDSVIEEKKEAEACAPHACMHFDSLTQCMARPGFAEAFADMICHTQDTEASAPHAFYAHALTNNWPAHSQYEGSCTEEGTSSEGSCTDALTRQLAEGSSSEGSCTDEGTGDEVDSRALIYDMVTALSEQDFDDGWVNLQRLTQATMDMCAISQHHMSCNMCLDFADEWVRHGVMRHNKDKTKIKFN